MQGMVGEAVVASLLQVNGIVSEDMDGDWFDQDGDIKAMGMTFEIKTQIYNDKHKGYIVQENDKLYESSGLFVVEVPLDFVNEVRILFTTDVQRVSIESVVYDGKVGLIRDKFEKSWIVDNKRIADEIRKYRISNYQPF